MAEQVPLEVIQIDPKDLKLLDKNAQYMDKQEYDNLVNNLKNDKALTSTPLVHKEEDGSLLVLSGNHRTQASIEAGLNEITILLTKGLTEEHKLALQLSHNSLIGKANTVVLKELYDQLKTLEGKAFSGLSDSMFQEMNKQLASISGIRLDYKEVVFLFLPEEIEKIDRIMETMEGRRPDQIRLVCLEDYPDFFEKITAIKKTQNIKNNATAFLAMLDMINIEEAE